MNLPNDEGVTNDDFDMNIDNILLDEEDDVNSYSPMPAERKSNPDSLAELQLQKEKAAKLEARLNQITERLESGQKVNFLESIFGKYADSVDPATKSMVAEILHGYNQASQAELKPLFEHLDSLKKDIIKTQQNIDKVSQHVERVQGSLAWDKLVRQSLQRAFVKHTISEDVVDAAKNLHLRKTTEGKGFDAKYSLELNNILNNPNLTVAQKDRLSGELLMETYRKEVVKRANAGKSKDSDPTAKKQVKKDPKVIEAEKQANKEVKKEEEVEEKKELTAEEKEKQREELRAKFAKRIGA